MSANAETNRLEMILEFATKLGRDMLQSGADLERVNDSITRICHAYRLEDIRLFSLNTVILLSAGLEGHMQSSQVCIESTGIHLERLTYLNQLSREVCSKTPEPEKLAGMLEEAEKTNGYPPLAILGGYLLAMCSMTILFEGNWRDILAVEIITALIWVIRFYFEKPDTNRIVFTLGCTWIAGVMSIFLVRLGVGENLFIIIVATSMLFVPGTALVNAVYDLLCRNEINGSLEVMRSLLKTLSIVGGYAFSIVMFGGGML